MICYFVLLVSFLALVLFTSLRTKIVTINEQNTSLAMYENLQVNYLTTLKCPCLNMIIPYGEFITLSPVLHQVCSSNFVTHKWISLLENIKTGHNTPDWRNRASLQFHLLSDLCKLAKKTVDDAVNQFLFQSFIASNVLTKIDFDEQIDTTLEQFFQSTVAYFGLLIETERILIQVDQPYFGSVRNIEARPEVENPILVFPDREDVTKVQVILQLTGPRSVKLISSNCTCATDIHCQSSIGIYDADKNMILSPNFTHRYTVPGSVAGCSATDSLMLSTLECYYSNSTCLSILMDYSKRIYLQSVINPSWFDVHPLIYDPTLSQFPPNTLISTILKNIMIEQWNSSYSYDPFYKSCAPSYCTYSKRIRAKTTVEVIVTLVSMIGTLILVLRLITPLLVKFLIRLFTRTDKRSQQQTTVRRGIFDRLKVFMLYLVRLLYTSLVNLNIFLLRDFGNKIDRMTAKRLGQWATRLYILLYVVSVAVLTIYTIAEPQTLTKTFNKLSINLCNQLFQRYGNELKCSCSSVASKYNRFVEIEAEFHEICSSAFSSHEGRINLTADVVANLSKYSQNDYRRFLSAHLQYLNGLCQLSNHSVNISIEQFYSSLFTTAELLSEINFNTSLNSIINQSKSNAPITVNRLLFLIRSINHGNAIISNYGTNFEYFFPWWFLLGAYAPTRAMIYDDKCSCGLTPNCTTQANFIERNSPEKISINGLKMGCTPSESFRASTLECFYNQSCINLIQNYTNNKYQTNFTNTFNPLTITKSRFSINTTIAELIDNLFIEEWKTMMNYTAYFEQCSPLLCSYTYVQRFNVYNIIILLFTIQGGLTIVLGWISPKIIRIIFKIYQYRKKRTNTVQPICVVETIPIENVNINIANPISNLEFQSTNVTSQTYSISTVRCSFKIILLCVLLLSILAALIIFSIYIARHKMNPTLLTTSSIMSTVTDSTTTMIINTITYSTTTMITKTTTSQNTACSLKFQLVSEYGLTFSPDKNTPVIADFNGDDQLDLAYVSNMRATIVVLLWNGNGNFRAAVETSLNVIGHVSDLVSGDFNNDNQSDIAAIDQEIGCVFILLGNDDGTFIVKTMLSIARPKDKLEIALTDFNGDRYLDIAVIGFSDTDIGLYLGKGDETFSAKSTLYIEATSDLFRIAVADFNLDSYQDIIVLHRYGKNIGILLGHGNGTFDTQKTFFTGGYYEPWYFAVGDFNSDTLPDIVVSYRFRNVIKVMYGYGNGTVGDAREFEIGDISEDFKVFVSDFNGDRHLDIGFGKIEQIMHMLVGDGNGNFKMQRAFSVEFDGSFTSICRTSDFNGDGYYDVVEWGPHFEFLNIWLSTCK